MRNTISFLTRAFATLPFINRNGWFGVVPEVNHNLVPCLKRGESIVRVMLNK